MSSGVPIRLIGFCATMIWVSESGQPERWSIGVSISPGAIAFTVTPRGPLVRHLPPAGLVQIEHRHVRPVARQAEADRPPDARGAAGHHRVPSAESHARAFSRPRLAASNRAKRAHAPRLHPRAAGAARGAARVLR